MSRCIDADALKLKCGDWYVEEGSEEGFIGTIEQLLDGQPTVEPERKTGEWITQEFGSWAECSECHELYDIPIAYSNFCPNCGTKMGECDI